MKWPEHLTKPVLAVLAAAVAIAWLPGGKQEETVGATKGGVRDVPAEAAKPVAQTAAAEHVELERLARQSADAGSGKPVANAFKSTSWYVPKPAPPAPPPPPPPAPTAPPLPFTYMGRYEDPSKVLVMLAAGNKLYTVSEGDVIDGNYRVDRITDSGVDLVYLPLNISQSLSTAGVPDTTQHRPGVEDRYRRP